MTDAIKDWLEALGTGGHVVRRRVEEFVRRGGEAAPPLIDQWLSQPAGRRLLEEVLASCVETATASVDGLRLLLLAAREAGSARGAGQLLGRLAAGPDEGAAFDLEALAAAVTPHAVVERHPEEILLSTVRLVLDPRVPLFSLAALEGTARLAAAGCRSQHREEDFALRARRELATGALLDSEVWKAAVKAEDGSSGERFRGLLAALLENHVDELVAACRRDLPRAEKTLVFALLSRLRMDRDQRLSARQLTEIAASVRSQGENEDRRDWSALDLWVVVDRAVAEEELIEGFERSGRLDRGLMGRLLDLQPGEDEREAWIGTLERLNRAAFSRGSVVPEGLSAWIRLDPATAGHVLTSELSLVGLSDGALAVVVDALVRLSTPGAVERLRVIAASPGAIGERAGTGLELVGATPPEGIDRLSAEWRRTRSSEALARLYNTYLDRLPSGAPFGPWRERLGEPSSEVGGSLWFESADRGYRLYLEIDREARLTAWSLR